VAASAVTDILPADPPLHAKRSFAPKDVPAAQFPGPCYALLGNHDYNVEPAGKCEAQLAYAAAQPGTRWTLPAKWYRFDFPHDRPLVTFLALDSNYQKATPEKLSLTPEERVAQAQWLKAELAKPRTTPFLIVCGHHPLYSNAGDSQPLIAEWDALFRAHAAHLYFCGHIHDLEHLEFKGHPTSFVVTGGGGTTLRTDAGKKSSALDRFAQNVHGFTHLEMSAERLVIRHLGGDGRQLHAFAKLPQGTSNCSNRRRWAARHRHTTTAPRSSPCDAHTRTLCRRLAPLPAARHVRRPHALFLHSLSCPGGCAVWSAAAV
jgi:hypothetical protein